MGNILPTPYGLEVALWIVVLQPGVFAWNDHYDKEDDAWVMKIFFPIIAALILLCVGSCGYANYCKQPTRPGDEEDEVDRSEDVYTLNKPDRPYLTPHYQRRTFQPPPPAYDNHAFRPTQQPLGVKQITTPSSLYQRHQPMGMNNSFVNSYQQFQPQAYNHNAIKPNPMRSYSFQIPQGNSHYAQSEVGDRSKSLWDVNAQSNNVQTARDQNYSQSGRASPIQSTRSAPAGFNNNSNLRRTYSSPNLTPSGSNGSFGNQYGPKVNQFSNRFDNTRHSINYGNQYQRTPSPASSNSTYRFDPAASEVGSTAPLFRRRSPGHQNVYEAHNPARSTAGSVYGGSSYGNQEFNQPRRPYEMEDIYGRGNGMSRYGFQHQQNDQYGTAKGTEVQFSNSYNSPVQNQFSNNYNQFQTNQFQTNQFQNNQFQPNQFQNNQFAMNGFQPFNQQHAGQQRQNFNQPQNNALYEHLQPRQDNYDNYNTGGGNFAYDPYNDPYNTHNSNLPGV